MPHIMVTSWWPMGPAKSAEIAKKAYEIAKKFPADESIMIDLAQGFLGSKMGVKSVAIVNVKEGKLEEAVARVLEIYGLYTEVEGFTYKAEIMVTVEEAWASVGMKPPE